MEHVSKEFSAMSDPQTGFYRPSNLKVLLQKSGLHGWFDFKNFILGSVCPMQDVGRRNSVGTLFVQGFVFFWKE
jgi:hypothetical protein